MCVKEFGARYSRSDYVRPIMKKKKFLKKYGKLTVQLFNVSLSEGLNFEGTTYDDQEVLVNLTGDLDNMTSAIYTRSNYSISYIVDNFPEFAIYAQVDITKPPYIDYCHFRPHKK